MKIISCIKPVPDPASRLVINETKTWIKNIADASNKAIDEFNKFNEEVKKKVDEDKD